MTSIGTGYDLSVSTYSPDGRVFQVEYAAKAVDNSGTAIGLRVKDGVVLAVEKLVQSKLLVPRSNRRIQTVDTHIGVTIADRVGHYAQAYTLYSNVRPFGSSAIIGTVDKEGPQLFMVEPSGVYWGYHGCAIGKGKQVAKTEIEKLKLAEMSVLDAVKEAARIIYTVHDEAKDKEFELELSWITEENRRHQFVPDDIATEAERLAKESLNEEMEDD
ncbi:17944_t:CDS:2 [Cetraspora pellucida]|uniref:Proteasome subunit alpha type n=1 Tax=Cetraspora pellucida TaxID=1433469 RepID=A0A9N9C5D2_9GLOM|nr:17944_t:CDS:2 [Cetraspora pellucida]